MAREIKLAHISDYHDIVNDRPAKLDAEEVGYRKVPDGSVMRCASCLHYFRRNIDGFATCEIFRSPESDAEGVKPDYRCIFWTVDGDVHPFVEVKEDLEKEIAEAEKDDATE